MLHPVFFFVCDYILSLQWDAIHVSVRTCSHGEQQAAIDLYVIYRTSGRFYKDHISILPLAASHLNRPLYVFGIIGISKDTGCLYLRHISSIRSEAGYTCSTTFANQI